MTSGRRTRPAPGSIEATQSSAILLAVIGAVMTLTLALYANSLDLLRTDVPIRASNGRLFWLLTLVAVIAFGYVVQRQSSERTHPGSAARLAPDSAASGAAMLPALVVFASVQLVAWDTRTAVVLAAPLLAGAGVFTSVVVRHYLLSGDPEVVPGARLIHLALTAGVALLTLSLVRGWMGGPGYTLVVVFVVAGLLLFQAFDGIHAFPVRRAAYALVGCAVVAQVALAMSYWTPNVWSGGAFLVTIFVVLMMTIESILTHRISTDIVARYVGAGVGACGLLIILAR